MRHSKPSPQPPNTLVAGFKFGFFFHTTTKKIISEEPGSSYTAIHILAPQLIEIRAKQRKVTVLLVQRREIWNNIPSYNKSTHSLQRI